MFKLSVVVSTHEASFEAVSFKGSVAESLAAVKAAGYPGAGHIDFGGLFRALKEIGYKDYVSGEFLPKPGGPTSIREGLRYLRPLMAESG